MAKTVNIANTKNAYGNLPANKFYNVIYDESTEYLYGNQGATGDIYSTSSRDNTGKNGTAIRAKVVLSTNQKVSTQATTKNGISGYYATDNTKIIPLISKVNLFTKGSTPAQKMQWMKEQLPTTGKQSTFANYFTSTGTPNKTGVINTVKTKYSVQ